MFRAIGVVIVMWYVSHLLASSTIALDHALAATFTTVEAAAVRARMELE